MKFQLLGHDNPLGQYPAPVVAVGKLDDSTVVVYATTKAQPEIVHVDHDVEFVSHTAETNRKIDGFDYRKHRLFAFDEQDLTYYSIQEEKKFFERLLHDNRIRRQDPFSRLSFAKGSRNIELVRREMLACLKDLSSQSDRSAQAFLESWYHVQLQMIGKHASGRKVFPEDWRELLKSSETQFVRHSSRFNNVRTEYGRVRMTQSEVVNQFAISTGMDRAKVNELLEELSNLAAREVKRRGEFTLPGFGKLVKSERKARLGRNPATGETIHIPAKTTLKFRVDNTLKENWGKFEQHPRRSKKLTAKYVKVRMSQSEVVNHFAETTGMNRAQIKEFFAELSILAAEEVKGRGEFTLPGFGKLVKSERKARHGRNPATGETIHIPAKPILKFHVGRTMKDKTTPKFRVGKSVKDTVLPKKS